MGAGARTAVVLALANWYGIAVKDAATNVRMTEIIAAAIL